METGTGKTFTYLNLIFELHKHYKQNKFIIFVPRKAILESVKQNVALTRDYFFNQYKQDLRIYTYEGSGKKQKFPSAIVNHYIKNTSELSVLILTSSAIDKNDNKKKSTNILHRQSENLFNEKSIFENIASLKPICIIDEPHLLKGEKFNESFSKIGTLHFRFGATFPQPAKPKNSSKNDKNSQKIKDFSLSNLAYCLDSINAFRKYLVKKIGVHTIYQDSQTPFLLSIHNKKAKIAFFKAGMENSATFGVNDDLGKLDSSLNGVSITKIEKDKVFLSNHTTIEKKQSYKLTESQITMLLSKAIDLHFEKESRLFSQNIKALSLFFIPNIEDFRVIEGKNAPFIKNEFERLYKQKRSEILQRDDLTQDYKNYLARDFDESGKLRVHQGYFSGDSQNDELNEKDEADGVAIILKEKEKLLSFDTPLRFIFSVWALQEGWDNPNIFTLTKLANSSSDTSRHQQVGRGLRLAVNKEGKRITLNYLNANDTEFFNINYLDMLVSGEESGFIENLQKEISINSFVIDTSYGQILSREDLEHLELQENEINGFLFHLENAKAIEFDKESNAYKITAPIFEAIKDNESIKNLLGEKFQAILNAFDNTTANKHTQIENANKPRETIAIRQTLAKDFKALWQSINTKAKINYSNINEENLIDSIANAFNAEQIAKESIFYEYKEYDALQDKIITKEIDDLGHKDYQKALQKDIDELILDFAKTCNFPLNFIIKLFAKLDKGNFTNSPKKAFKLLSELIKDDLHKNLLSCVRYDFCQNEFSNTPFSDTDPLFTSGGDPKKSIQANRLGRYKSDKAPAEHYLYEKIIYDSNIEINISEEDIQKAQDFSIEVFAKLPKFSIPTPYKEYQPDFAYLLKGKNESTIFFVCETKGYDKEYDISSQELRKIDYAKRFFENLNEHFKATKQNTRVIFTTRINKQDLLNTINQALKDTK